MEIKFSGNTFGISLGPSKIDADKLVATSQTEPKDSYVYGHYDSQGNLFYVGKGVKKRAWSKERHPLWIHYVEKHLNNQYSVKIFADDISNEEAEYIEESLINEHGESLVNWINYGRQQDFAALEKYHQLRNKNRYLISSSRGLEERDPEKAVENYIEAIQKIPEYAFMETEGGFVGKLRAELAREEGLGGDIEAINRLTLLLCKLGRADEANQHMTQYFETFKKDLSLKGSDQVLKRVEKALAKNK